MKFITGTTKLLGVIGDPVEHSLSPVMHNAAIATLGADFVYLPLPVRAEQLSQALSGFETIGLMGFNVTIPHKQAILPLLSDVTPTAQQVGAVNTVWRTGNGWSGTNTDVTGFLAPLRNLSRNWHQITPVILGNGGAARAVVVGCSELGCQAIHVIGRSEEKLNQFQQSWSSLPAQVHTHLQSELPILLSQTELLVNTTPIGMHPNCDRSPLPIELVEQLQPSTVVYDLIYTPSPTQFLKQAQTQGATTINGLEMLVHQGAAALEIWLKQPAPVEVMCQSLKHHLGFDEGYEMPTLQ